MNAYSKRIIGKEKHIDIVKNIQQKWYYIYSYIYFINKYMQYK